MGGSRPGNTGHWDLILHRWPEARTAGLGLPSKAFWGQQSLRLGPAHPAPSLRLRLPLEAQLLVLSYLPLISTRSGEWSSVVLITHQLLEGQPWPHPQP